MKTNIRIALIAAWACSWPLVSLGAERKPQEANLSVTTPIGPDVLFPAGLKGHEGISMLFQFQLDLLAAPARTVPFEALLGQDILVSLALPEGSVRYFGGICSRVSQGDRKRGFATYQVEVMPKLWLLTRTARSRIFQQLSVPDILRQVLAEGGVDFEMRLEGHFEPRNYVVQYRETDFAFASRLMEEDGIYYFFAHTDSGHQMVLANTAAGHPDVPSGIQTYQLPKASGAVSGTIFEWTKTQTLRSGKYTLWDYCFELPQQNLEATAPIQPSAQVGQILHLLRLDANAKLEIYDYPGEYAQRFDGVDPGGGDQPNELQKIFVDKDRTVGIRMQEEAAQSLVVHASSTSPALIAGHKFTLEKHFDANGDYVITSVQHSVRDSSERGSKFDYANSFTCLPASLPFRPPRRTPKPVLPGTQTAIVVGPAGEEIFTDKYGRVKVQFHWDRDGRNDANSSCWVRVGALNAGLEAGPILIPRIGYEVIVSFLEGDPDQPIIVGSVFNGQHLPSAR
ncbi:MAG: type VI secretion system tip protein VgrG [Verrucomicrobiales bacterium]|nr:type VI secretion system tip protein VgrG [Verrucomicrobiales bacterium]